MAIKNVNVAEQKSAITIRLDNTVEQIIAFNQDETVELFWDYKSFRKLSDEVLKQLSMENLKRYFTAQQKAEDYAKSVVVEITNPLGGAGNAYDHRMNIRKRPGYHGYWANPGADFERCMASGAYTQVRKPTDKQEKEGYQPGEESGEVLKRMTAEGKVEAIALECTQEAYEQYLEWMSQESAKRFTQMKQNFFQNTEDLNRGARHRDERIIPIDTTGELQA